MEPAADEWGGIASTRTIRGRTALGLACVVVIIALITAAAISKSGDPDLSVSEAILLGVVEGVTEYLPVSSTAHLAVVEHGLGLTSTVEGQRAADAYAVIIQIGAIAAVAGLYRARIVDLSTGLLVPRRPLRSPARALVAAFVPAAVIGFALGDAIQDRLFAIWPIVAAWAVGGVVLLSPRWTAPWGHRPFESLNSRDGLIIGLAQTLALWPGTSRSLVTILTALAIGFTLSAAVEFSFLLGLITLGAATGYQLLRDADVIVDQFGIVSTVAGVAAAAITAWAAVRWMVGYLEQHPLTIFGWYRLGAAAAVGVTALFTNVL
ncbi:undecaprenyl-diphosphate phosphatase [Ilumatobacter nonamiensis]|uniref:undecaprenyl-diphosphate phosphatase n=1 Tax=Ilumatobacter nonamiensis TaxID=467093 RepID=UPI00034DC57B|nr:undecaprenyl-diphosphate phosphatase [Ilumatobacter nonamiensis]